MSRARAKNQSTENRLERRRARRGKNGKMEAERQATRELSEGQTSPTAHSGYEHTGTEAVISSPNSYGI
mgnify:CR=1 FL=1